MKTLTFNLIGDEEAAAAYKGLACSMYRNGLLHATPDSMTTILIRDGAIPSCDITVHMDCPYHLMVPRTDETGVNNYTVGLIGYSHRKDAIVPHGAYRSPAYGDEGMFQYGNEIRYISDGIALHGACVGIGSFYPAQPDSFYATVTVGGAVTEDVQNVAGRDVDNVGSSTPQGYIPQKRYFVAARVVSLQGNNTYSLVPHKVDRTDATKPIYTGLLGYSYLVSGDPVYQYQDTTLVCSYYEFQHRLGYVSEGKTTSEFNAYYLGDDFCDTVGRDWSSVFPVLWNISNGQTVMLMRKRTNDATKWFGGTFSFSLILIEGPTIIFYDLALTGLLSPYFYQSWWSFVTTDYPNTSTQYGHMVIPGSIMFAPHDYLRMSVLMHEFGMNMKKAAVVVADGTLLTFSVRVRCHRPPTNYAWGSELCCFAVTASGVYQRSKLFTYWAYYEYSGGEDAPVPRIVYTDLRAVYLGNNTVALFYEKQTETGTGTAVWVSDGWFRIESTDNGYTWGTPAAVTFVDVDASFEWSRPLMVSAGATAATTKLIAGYMGKTISGGTKTYEQASVLLSDDGGATWTKSIAAAPTINYQADTSVTFVNGDSGVGSLHNHGSWEDGYEPSPHKHLPNFYGIPTAISRNSSGDPGQ